MIYNDSVSFENDHMRQAHLLPFIKVRLKCKLAHSLKLPLVYDTYVC